jgi:hypothetical protein
MCRKTATTKNLYNIILYSLDSSRSKYKVEFTLSVEKICLSLYKVDVDCILTLTLLLLLYFRWNFPF